MKRVLVLVAIGMFYLQSYAQTIPDIEMVLVKGGTFTMGCTAEQGGDCDNDEKPAHKVTLSDFYIGKYEITRAQWEKVMGVDPSEFPNCKTCPVELFSWEEVQEFIRKLNAQTGMNYRLPTEAEWEYAARGGLQSRGYKYSGSNNVDEVADYGYNFNEPYPVGTKKPNELGIYDMSGNAWELCSDWYGEYSSKAQPNPKGPAEGNSHVVRGGSCNSGSWDMRISRRHSDEIGEDYTPLGFRLVRSVK
jgi:formylglycine-generating enzyme required for sulfatase activity